MHWVFAYGSLIWKPDFAFVNQRPASLHGYGRRFWQGSHDHRGTPDAPGRVVTLIPIEHAICRGMAYQIDDESVFEALDHREKNGYQRTVVMLHPEQEFPEQDQSTLEPFEAIAWVAEPGNFAYVGEASITRIAQQIAASTGPSGRNDDYVFELANVLADMGVIDPHIIELESALRALGANRQHSENRVRKTP